MKRFLTLFPLSENIHLTKDVGMIPYILYTDYGYDSTIACYKNGEYPYLEKEVKGLKIVFINKVFNNLFADSLLFILLNIRRYDVLQIYHLNKLNAGLAYLFKILTFNRGRTYLKLDTDDSILSIKFPVPIGSFYKFLLGQITCISVETKYIYNVLNDKKILGREILYLPNGFYEDDKNEIRINKIDFDKKKNKIITVGRIGTAQKNNEVLLEAFANFATRNDEWCLELIGPIEPGFEEYIKEYFNKNSNLINRINFTGLITDKKLLAEKYNEAKIFVLTSRFEGFALVYLEAMQAGCYMLLSDLLPARDATDNEKYGKLFKIGDAEHLTRLLLNTVADQQKLKDNCTKVHDYVYTNFNWSVILKTLDNNLRDAI